MDHIGFGSVRKCTEMGHPVRSLGDCTAALVLARTVVAKVFAFFACRLSTSLYNCPSFDEPRTIQSCVPLRPANGCIAVATAPL